MIVPVTRHQSEKSYSAAYFSKLAENVDFSIDGPHGAR